MTAIASISKLIPRLVPFILVMGCGHEAQPKLVVVDYASELKLPFETAQQATLSSGKSWFAYEGACRMLESSVECWQPDGSRFERLEERFSEVLEDQSFPLARKDFDDKNRRIIVFRQRRDYSNPHQGLSVKWMHTAGDGTTSSFLGLPDGFVISNSITEDLQYQSVVLKSGADGADAVLEVEEGVGVSEEFPLTVGQKFSLDGAQFQLLSITPCKVEDAKRMTVDGVLWKVDFSRTGGHRPVTLTLDLWNHNGKPVGYTSPWGDAYTADEVNAVREQEGVEDLNSPAGQAFLERYRTSTSWALPLTSQDLVSVMITANPAAISKVRAAGHSTKVVRMLGLRANPSKTASTEKRAETPLRGKSPSRGS